MTDQTILDLFWQRSEDAIRCTAEKYGAYLMKIAMNILRQNEESEECVSDTYLSAWEQIPPDCPQRLLPYLGRITRCHALNRWDYLTAQKRNPEFCVQLEELAECLSSPDTVESQYEGQELSAAISAFLRTLDARKRNVFIRRYWFSDSFADIARRFGISEGSARILLFRVRGQLKAYLEREGYHL